MCPDTWEADDRTLAASQHQEGRGKDVGPTGRPAHSQAPACTLSAAGLRYEYSVFLKQAWTGYVGAQNGPRSFPCSALTMLAS